MKIVFSDGHNLNMANTRTLRRCALHLFDDGVICLKIILTTEDWSCNTLKKVFYENLYFLVTNVFSVSKHILRYLNISSFDLANRFKLKCICLTDKTVLTLLRDQ